MKSHERRSKESVQLVINSSPSVSVDIKTVRSSGRLILSLCSKLFFPLTFRAWKKSFQSVRWLWNQTVHRKHSLKMLQFYWLLSTSFIIFFSFSPVWVLIIDASIITTKLCDGSKMKSWLYTRVTFIPQHSTLMEMKIKWENTVGKTVFRDVSSLKLVKLIIVSLPLHWLHSHICAVVLGKGLKG